MATKNIVPRGNLEGNLGTEQKRWSGAYVGNLDVSGNTKLTFANGTITDIATQVEAEAGTDNTKVMTPKGVNYRLNKDRRYKSFASVNDIGCTQNDTLETIIKAMPYSSVLVFYVSASSTSGDYFPNLSPTLPFGGKLTISKGCTLNVPATMELQPIDTKFKYFATYSTLQTPNFSGWIKIAINSALSMPSSKFINTSFVPKSAEESYIAPCDGYIFIMIESSSNSPCYARINDAQIMCTHMSNAAAGTKRSIFLPVSKEMTLYVYLSADVTILRQKFYYAQSEV